MCSNRVCVVHKGSLSYHTFKSVLGVFNRLVVFQVREASCYNVRELDFLIEIGMLLNMIDVYVELNGMVC